MQLIEVELSPLSRCQVQLGGRIAPEGCVQWTSWKGAPTLLLQKKVDGPMK